MRVDAEIPAGGTEVPVPGLPGAATPIAGLSVEGTGAQVVMRYRFRIE